MREVVGHPARSLHITIAEEGASAMMWVCPLCWQMFSTHQARCPACGADLTVLDQRSYSEKLIRALDHPEPNTAMRAAQILVRRGDPEHTIPILALALRRRWHEPYVAAAFVRALGEFECDDSHDVLIEALGHESVIVRAAAAESLLRRPEPLAGQPADASESSAPHGS